MARFQEVLWAMLSTGQGHLADRQTGEAPTHDKGRYGWKSWGDTARESGTHLGWVDDRGIYLIPEAAYKAVSEFIRGQGDALPMSPPVLWKRCAERGLTRKQQEDRNKVKVTAAGSLHTVIHFLTGGYGSESGITGTSGPDDLLDGVNAVPFLEPDGIDQGETGTIQAAEPLPLMVCPESPEKPQDTPKESEHEVREW